MVSSKQTGNPADYQRNINQGIRKVIGSSNRGFASMDPERQRGIVTHGGNTSREGGNAHEFTSQQHREAPAKGDSTGAGGSTGGAAGAGSASGSGSGQGDR